MIGPPRRRPAGCENQAVPALPGLRDQHAARRALEAALAPGAARTWPAERAAAEPDCPLRTPLQRDRDRVVHSKSFRRLKHKTQVFLAPEGDHYRTRLTHTLEVTGVARTVARALALNEDLTEAIGLGHDLGHAPFGHLGEEALDAAVREHGGDGFRHYEHSVRLVERLEERPSAVREAGGAGLNLCADVVDGIAGHSGRAPRPRTLEGAVVRVVDRIAYLNHDVDDAVRAGVISERDLPSAALDVLGPTASRRIDALVQDLVATSGDRGEVTQGEACAAAMDELRAWMFERVYLARGARAERDKVRGVVGRLLAHAVEHPESVGEGAVELGADPLRRATDWVAGMTDRYALRAFVDLAVPRSHAA